MSHGPPEWYRAWAKHSSTRRADIALAAFAIIAFVLFIASTVMNLLAHV